MLVEPFYLWLSHSSFGAYWLSLGAQQQSIFTIMKSLQECHASQITGTRTAYSLLPMFAYTVSACRSELRLATVPGHVSLRHR